MLKTIPVEDFQRYYQKWEQRLHRCVAAQENYFERITLMFEKIKKTLVNKKSVPLLFCHTLYLTKRNVKHIIPSCYYSLVLTLKRV